VQEGARCQEMALSARRLARLGLRLRRLREALERNRDVVAVAPSPYDRGTTAHADKPGAMVSEHHGLVRLKGRGRAELQLEEFRASDRVQSEGVHALRVRQGSRSSFWASLAEWRGWPP
jgi:hypothetical protein